MKRFLLLTGLVLSLTACHRAAKPLVPAPQTGDVNTMLQKKIKEQQAMSSADPAQPFTIELKKAPSKKSVPDMPLYDYTMSFSDPLNQEFVVWSGRADLKFVDSALVKSANTVGMFSGYAPGQGHDIKLVHDRDFLDLYERDNGEGIAEVPGECGKWKALASLTLAAGTKIHWKYEGEPKKQLEFECAD